MGLTRRGSKWHIIGVDEFRFKQELAKYGSAISYCDSEVIKLVKDGFDKPIYFSIDRFDLFKVCTNCIKASGLNAKT